MDALSTGARTQVGCRPGLDDRRWREAYALLFGRRICRRRKDLDQRRATTGPVQIILFAERHKFPRLCGRVAERGLHRCEVRQDALITGPLDGVTIPTRSLHHSSSVLQLDCAQARQEPSREERTSLVKGRDESLNLLPESFCLLVLHASRFRTL
jgi:hypothetical protein